MDITQVLSTVATVIGIVFVAVSAVVPTLLELPGRDRPVVRDRTVPHASEARPALHSMDVAV